MEGKSIGGFSFHSALLRPCYVAILGNRCKKVLACYVSCCRVRFFCHVMAVMRLINMVDLLGKTDCCKMENVMKC